MEEKGPREQSTVYPSESTGQTLFIPRSNRLVVVALEDMIAGGLDQ